MIDFISGLIKQFLKDVDWGDIDYMVIDTPPGTSDEHLSIVQYLSEASVDGAIIVTTPQVAGLFLSVSLSVFYFMYCISWVCIEGWWGPSLPTSFC